MALVAGFGMLFKAFIFKSSVMIIPEKLKIGNTQKVNLIEKGISTLRIEPLFIQGIRKYFSDVKFDLVLYATPPVTFAKVIDFVKKRDGAKSYLMLKDIFPQNSVDLGMLTKSGIKGLIYKYFRHKEKSMYALSDKIGCMSQANADYVLKHNPEIPQDKVEICPNSVEPIDMRVSEEEKSEIRKKYDLPLDKKIFVYGGNLGRPQDVPFIVDCLKACSDIEDSYFVIAGSGTDRQSNESFVCMKSSVLASKMVCLKSCNRLDDLTGKKMEGIVKSCKVLESVEDHCR